MVNVKITTKAKIRTACVMVLFLGILYMAASQHISLGQTYKQVYFNDAHIGDVNYNVAVEDLARETRKEMAQVSEDRLAIDYRVKVVEAKKPFVSLMPAEELQQLLRDKLVSAAVNGGVKGYTIEIEGYQAVFASMDEVKNLLNGVKATVDEKDEYTTLVKKEDGHVKGIMTAELVRTERAPWEEVIPEASEVSGLSAGITSELMSDLSYAMANPYINDYKTGIVDMEFIESVTIYESYVTEEELDDVETELVEVTKEKETNKIYVVQSGDSLSLIAYENDTTIASIMQLNGFKDMNQIIRVEDELIIAVPEPDLMLRVKKGEVYEEDFEADPIIIENKNWYTTKQVVHEAGTVGHRERNDVVTFENGIEIDREMIYENVMIESKPAVIEKGTIIPPTYVRPINGGRQTSPYGKRWGKLHKGVDWAIPTGTRIFASCAGTVVRSEYHYSYGYYVLLSHADGRMTRYAHCSKLLVSVGQKVKQGETIALSGNTGNSTGPHLHFEMIINGKPVNPLKYIK